MALLNPETYRKNMAIHIDSVLFILFSYLSHSMHFNVQSIITVRDTPLPVQVRNQAIRSVIAQYLLC
jgi:hypothetical protein